MKLIELEFRPALAKDDALPTGVGLPFGLDLGARELRLTGVDRLFEGLEAGFALGEVGEVVEVVVVEDCEQGWSFLLVPIREEMEGSRAHRVERRRPCA